MPSLRGWLLDTNVVSELRKGQRGDPRVTQWARSVTTDETFLSRMTVVEIRLGIEQASDPTFQRELEAWLSSELLVAFERRILDVDELVLTTWRRLLGWARKAKVSFSEPDLIIGATALAHDLAVVTRNTADFALMGVRLLDPWRAPATP